MRTIPAGEIERCGLRAVDEALKAGPVHVIQDDAPRYVVLTAAQYAELLEDREEAYILGIREALADVAAGRVRESSAEEIIREFGLEEE